jgi:hypothetical protein
MFNIFLPMKFKNIILATLLITCCISLNSCILLLPFQVVGDVIKDITP